MGERLRPEVSETGMLKATRIAVCWSGLGGDKDRIVVGM